MEREDTYISTNKLIINTTCDCPVSNFESLHGNFIFLRANLLCLDIDRGKGATTAKKLAGERGNGGPIAFLNRLKMRGCRSLYLQWVTSDLFAYKDFFCIWRPYLNKVGWDIFLAHKALHHQWVAPFFQPTKLYSPMDLWKACPSLRLIFVLLFFNY